MSGSAFAMGASEGNVLPQEEKQRILWIDIMRGILIILMVLGHCGAPFTKAIYMFHMAAFIFLSGYTARPKKQPLLGCIWKRAKGILVPYVVWNMAFMAFYSMLQRRGNYLLFPETYALGPQDFIKNLATTDLGGATWFLPVLFTTSVLYQLLYCALKAGKCERFVPIAAILLGILGFHLCRTGRFLPYMFDLSLHGLIYYAAGDIFATYEVFEKHISSKAMNVICVTMLIIFGYIRPDIRMSWPGRNFEGLFECMMCFLSGTYLCYQSAEYFCSQKVIAELLSFFGKNSMTVLIFHFAAIRGIFAVLVLLRLEPVTYLRNLTPPGDLPLEWFVVSAGALLICGCIAKFAGRWPVTKYLFTGHSK